MWTIEEGFIDLIQGQSAYPLPAATIDLLEQVIRTNQGNANTQSDLTISRISMPTYASIPNKLTQGRPIQINVERLRDAPVVNIWPVPDQGTAVAPFYVLRYWRMRRIENAGAGAETPDVSFRFLPCLVAGLAYYIASKDPDLVTRIPMLQAEYERQFELAAGEDREKATIRLVPRLSSY
jgi:hypothetical protein